MVGRNVCLLTLLLGFFSACQPDELNELPVADNDQIIIGQIEKFDSAVLAEERDLWIYLPPGAEDPENIGQKYPVLYLLDGNGHFHSVSGMIKQLSTVNGNTLMPEMIVVGIPNTDRMRDLTPTHVEGTSGGGDNFLDFIEHELIPHIESNYPVTSYRTFVGHSLGGLMVIDALSSRPHVFDNYIAIDPSLWWDQQVILRKAEAALLERNYAGKSLYVAVAHTMSDDMTVDEVVHDDDESTLHIRSILQFSKSAETASAETTTGNELEFGWRYYADDSHGSVPLIAEYDAFRFLFPWYELSGINGFLSPDSTVTASELTNHVTSHYLNVSAHLGVEVLPPAQFINLFGQAMLANEKPEHAFALFSLNLQNYPHKAMAHAAMGDYYLAQSKLDSAREYFTQSIELGASPDIETKLAALDKL